MLLDLISGNGFSINTVISLLARVFVVFCTMPIHEYAHAKAAYLLGDDTARLKGRLTLNPLAHIDLIGALMIFLAGFGYAKPVPVNARNFKNPKKGMALTAAAGPASNLIMALFFMILANICVVVLNNDPEVLVFQVAMTFFMYAARINVSLAVFNILPIPPLDGSRIISLVLPSKYYFAIMKYERYIILGVFALLLFGVLDIPLSFLSDKVMWLISVVAGLPFGEYGKYFVAFFR